MSNKLYISNMCQAGFIHKNTQTIPYQHPFIFCCFIEDDFVKFVEDFDDTNFSNYKKLHYHQSKIFNHKDNYSWDGANRRLGINVENTPTIEFENGVQIIYPHINYDSFDEKYEKRLKRFLENKDKDIYFIFRIRNHMDKSVVDMFYNCNKYKKILLFDENVSYRHHYTENVHTKIVVTNYEHNYLIKYLKHIGILENY